MIMLLRNKEWHWWFWFTFYSQVLLSMIKMIKYKIDFYYKVEVGKIHYWLDIWYYFSFLRLLLYVQELPNYNFRWTYNFTMFVAPSLLSSRKFWPSCSWQNSHSALFLWREFQMKSLAGLSNNKGKTWKLCLIT